MIDLSNNSESPCRKSSRWGHPWKVSMLTLAALATGPRASAHFENIIARPSLKNTATSSRHNRIADNFTSDCVRNTSSDLNTYRNFTPADYVIGLVKRAGLTPKRSFMSDESTLFEFFGSSPRDNFVGVEVYSTGEIIVVVQKDEIDEYYELNLSETSLIISLLKNGSIG